MFSSDSECPLRDVYKRQIDHPVTNRRQDSTLGRNIAEQQGMVGDHHIGMRRATAGAVDQAFIGEERA